MLPTILLAFLFYTPHSVIRISELWKEEVISLPFQCPHKHQDSSTFRVPLIINYSDFSEMCLHRKKYSGENSCTQLHSHQGYMFLLYRDTCFAHENLHQHIWYQFLYSLEKSTLLTKAEGTMRDFQRWVIPCLETVSNIWYIDGNTRNADLELCGHDFSGILKLIFSLQK